MPLFEKILKNLPFSSDELRVIIATAPLRYKVYQIPKSQPGKFRTIAQPTPEVKLIQRWLLSEVLSRLPVHKSASAYVVGKSIADHAALHARNRFLLKMDFKDFFPSISSEDVRRHLIEQGKFSPEDASLVCRLVCWRNKKTGEHCLSIGAPSSPFLSNSILYGFDKKIAKLARDRKVVYSRYADDLAFSTNKENVLSEILLRVADVCTELSYPRLEINKKKTVSTSRAFRRSLVGLVLTPVGGVSLGREKKRRLRSSLYRFTQGLLPIEEISALRGELAFAWSVESEFIKTLLRQFGDDAFRKLELPFRSES